MMQALKDLTPYICVHYPGRVVNPERMMETLGGVEYISDVICDDRRKPQLWFRPDDLLNKPVNGTRELSSSLVMKVRVKKKTKKIVSQTVIGYITEEFSFQTLCDFQYLAMHNGINVYNKVVPADVNPDWIKGDGIPMLVPSYMSRIDTVQNYHFGRDKGDKEDYSQVISSSRRKRYGLARFVTFEDTEVPTTPKEMPPHIAKPLKSEGALEIVRKAFEDRPIYSKTALAAVTTLSLTLLKDTVPFAAYHCTNGPWRAMWVKLGYDPRTNPSCKIYQTLDFRFRSEHQDANIQMKRSNRNLSIPRLNKKPPTKNDRVPPDGHIFQPGKLPPYRVVYYQYCDIRIPEIQDIIETAEVRSVCDILDGWLPEGTSFACRRIMNNYVAECVRLQPSDHVVAELSQPMESDSSQSDSQSETDQQI